MHSSRVTTLTLGLLMTCGFIATPLFADPADEVIAAHPPESAEPEKVYVESNTRYRSTRSDEHCFYHSEHDHIHCYEEDPNTSTSYHRSTRSRHEVRRRSDAISTGIGVGVAIGLPILIHHAVHDHRFNARYHDRHYDRYNGHYSSRAFKKRYGSHYRRGKGHYRDGYSRDRKRKYRAGFR